MLFQEKAFLMIFLWAHIFSHLSANLMKTNKQKYRSINQGETLKRDMYILLLKSKPLHSVSYMLAYMSECACWVVHNQAVSKQPDMFVRISIRYMYKCSVKWNRNRKVWWIIIFSAWLLQLFWWYHVWMPGSCSSSHECTSVSVQKRIRLAVLVLLRNNNSVFLSWQLLRTMSNVS